MKDITRKKTAIASALILLLVISACSSTSGDNESPTQTASASKQDPFGKYDPPIEVTTVKSLDDFTMSHFSTGETIDKNVWTDAFESVLGIKLKVQWLVPDAQYNQKLNVTIASNDLPDIMQVNAVQLKQLVDNGMIQDLTKVFNDYKSDLISSLMTSDEGFGLKQATFNGKLMAIPQLSDPTGTSPVMWIRKDWLDSLGLQPPKTMDDLVNIAKAFTLNDPDKNGKKDTIGLGLEKGLFGGIYGMNGFFNGYHALVMGTPSQMLWNKDSSGKLVAGEIVPAAKTALAKLAEMYKAGYLDQEFAVKDTGKVSESVVSEKIGMFYGQAINAFSPLSDAVTKNKTAEWRAYPIPSVDGKQTIENLQGVTSFFVVKKGMKNPEAAIKLLNYFIRKGDRLSKEYEVAFRGGPDKVKDPTKNTNEHKLTPIWLSHPRQNILVYRGLAEYAKTKDRSKLAPWSAPDNDVYMNQLNEKYNGTGGQGLAGGVKTEYWGGWVYSEGPFSAFGIINDYLVNNQIINPVFWGPATPTMTAKQSTLDKMALEEFTKIIMGSVPVDDFDNYVKSWNSLGGADITKEVNDWAATQK